MLTLDDKNELRNIARRAGFVETLAALAQLAIEYGEDVIGEDVAELVNQLENL